MTSGLGKDLSGVAESLKTPDISGVFRVLRDYCFCTVLYRFFPRFPGTRGRKTVDYCFGFGGQMAGKCGMFFVPSF